MLLNSQNLELTGTQFQHVLNKRATQIISGTSKNMPEPRTDYALPAQGFLYMPGSTNRVHPLHRGVATRGRGGACEMGDLVSP